MSAKYALNRSLSRADSSGSFNNNNSSNKKPQNDYSNLNETEITALNYDDTPPTTNNTSASFSDRINRSLITSNTPKLSQEYALNPEFRKKNSIYILDQDASIIMHQHHFDVNKYRSGQEAPIYMPMNNNINHYDTYSISNKKFIQQQQPNYSYTEDIRRKSPSPVTNRNIRFDDANNRIYDFLPNQAIRQNMNYSSNRVDMASPNFKLNEYQQTRNRGLNGSYMSNSSNSSGGGGGVVDTAGGFINRSNSAGMRASSTSSSSSSSAFLDRKESMRIGLQYLPSSLGYSSIGKDLVPIIVSIS